MLSNVQSVPTSKWMLWGGYIASAIPVLMLLFSGIMKFLKPPSLVEEFERLGYGENLALIIGIGGEKLATQILDHSKVDPVLQLGERIAPPLGCLADGG